MQVSRGPGQSFTPPPGCVESLAWGACLDGLAASRQNELKALPDPLAFIYGNRLPRYLWDDGRWGERLTTKGVALATLLKVAGARRCHFLRWVRGEATWLEYIESVQKGLLR